MHLGYFWQKPWHQELQKSPNLATLKVSKCSVAWFVCLNCLSKDLSVRGFEEVRDSLAATNHATTVTLSVQPSLLQCDQDRSYKHFTAYILRYANF